MGIFCFPDCAADTLPDMIVHRRPHHIAAIRCMQGRAKPDLMRRPYRLAWALASILESIPLLGYGVTREPFINRQMLGLMARELTLVDTKARRYSVQHGGC